MEGILYNDAVSWHVGMAWMSVNNAPNGVKHQQLWRHKLSLNSTQLSLNQYKSINSEEIGKIITPISSWRSLSVTKNVVAKLCRRSLDVWDRWQSSHRRCYPRPRRSCLGTECQFSSGFFISLAIYIRYFRSFLRFFQ